MASATSRRSPAGAELVEQVARPAHGRRATTDGDPEPKLGTAVRPAHAGLETDVVNRGERVVLGAPFEGDLELARQRRRQGVPQEVPGQRIGERGDVKELALGHTGVRAAGDVAHRVPAGFARGDTDIGEELHRQLHIVQFHEMELDVLACGDVAKAARIGLGHRREGVQLAQVEHSLRHLDPKHVDVAVLPLAIGPAHQAKRAPFVGADLPTLELLQRGEELVDVVLVGERETRATEGLRIVNGCHYRAPALPEASDCSVKKVHA